MITSFRRFAIVGTSAVAVLLVGLAGCDSSPAPPTDVPPSVSKDVPPASPRAGGTKKSIKNRPPVADAPAPNP